MNNTTIEALTSSDDLPITDSQIFALEAEAAEAGDDAMIRICEKALAGNVSARCKCANAIADAEAQSSEHRGMWVRAKTS